MPAHHNILSQKSKKVDISTPHSQAAQGINNNMNNARSQPVQDNEDAAEEPQTREVFEPIHQLASDLDGPQEGVAAAAVKVLSIDRAESRLDDLSKIQAIADACGTPLHAIVNRIQQVHNKLQSAIDKAKLMIASNPSNNCEEEVDKDFEDGLISDCSAGSDIPAVPNCLQQTPHKQVDQSQISVVEPSVAADVAYPMLPWKAAKSSARRIDVNRRPSFSVALDDAATSSGAVSLRRGKRIRERAQNQEREDKRQRRS
ncbi:uncharacterized protein EAF01_010699 [Botrytis porri]|uniref:Uncharacterized protein n=1 Tax=Botrytis porri TaxID=87229 RepID=A0A4Z1KVT2_9HELO|nr:uncharacterized protein EAF01_010699 [Botrytis porri]KAF7890890.1 hypothetical protein EAF01_010699 [Botrytis porri]TGO88617.1 hypothetical protein BPOR_0151g00010 [Botrytis porri]